MKSLKLITNILSAIVYVCIIGFLAIAAPLVMGYHPVVVLSGSMEPTYHVGSVIYYKATPFEQINVGDPITFVGAEGGAMVTHRVIEKDESARAFGTEGDANGSMPMPMRRKKACFITTVWMRNLPIRWVDPTQPPATLPGAVFCC